MLHITSGKDNIVFKRKKMNLVHLNEKIRLEKILGWMYARGGGGHSDAYCVQQGGWGGLKIGKKCVCN